MPGSRISLSSGAAGREASRAAIASWPFPAFPCGPGRTDRCRGERGDCRGCRRGIGPYVRPSASTSGEATDFERRVKADRSKGNTAPVRLLRGRSVPSAPSARSTATPGSGELATLPAGYYRFTNSTGFSIGVPRGWQISHVGHYMYITDPANSGISAHRPVRSAQGQPAGRLAATGGGSPGHLPRLPPHLAASRSLYAGRKGGRLGIHLRQEWRYGPDMNRNVLANAHHAYALYWSTPTSDWNAYYHYFQVFAATFRPASDHFRWLTGMTPTRASEKPASTGAAMPSSPRLAACSIAPGPAPRSAFGGR